MHSIHEEEVERSSGEWDKLRKNKWIKIDKTKQLLKQTWERNGISSLHKASKS